MLIRVMYRNLKYDVVKDFFLENLISVGGVKKFYRSGGWVEVGRDPVRRENSPPLAYTGPERREPVVRRPLDSLIQVGRRHYQPFPPGTFER